MSLWSISITDCGFVGVMWSYVVGAGGRRGCLRILQSMNSTLARPERNPNSDTQNQYLLCKVGAVALLGVALELLHLGPQLEVEDLDLLLRYLFTGTHGGFRFGRY